MCGVRDDMLMLLLMITLAYCQPINSQHQQPRMGCPCSISSESSSSVYEHYEITSMKTHEISCCPNHLLHHGNHQNVKIIWQHGGVQYPWNRGVSSFARGFCGNQTLQTDAALPADRGNFTCTLVSQEGKHLLTKTISICVNINDDPIDPPSVSAITEEVWSLPGQKAVLNCSAFVGSTHCGSSTGKTLTWTKENNETWIPVTQLPDVIEEFHKDDKEGIIQSVLVVDAVKSVHYGRYRCTVVNQNGVLVINATLNNGVPPEELQGMKYRAALVVLVAVLVIITIFSLMGRRCHLALALYFRTSSHTQSDDGKTDVLVVGGESSSLWIWSVLLPILEDTYHYTCFFPQRDMHAGGLILEEVAAAVWRCRRVVVVVTPCLMQCPWAAWALHHALQASLKAHTRIIALILQDIKPNEARLYDHTGIMKNLKLVRSLRVPASCGLKALQDKDMTQTGTVQDKGKKESKAGKQRDGGKKNTHKQKDKQKIGKKLLKKEKEKDTYKIERKERMSRLEVPNTGSRLRSRSRSRSRSKSPFDCDWKLINEEERQELDTDYTSESVHLTAQKEKEAKEEALKKGVDENLRPHGLTLTLPELTCPSGSRSPGCQRLSNMINSSNATSRESLGQGKNERKSDVPFVEGLQELDSPSSLTPFILTAPETSVSVRGGMSVCDSLKLLCSGNPETVFWNTLIYRLGSPTATPTPV